MKPSLEIERLPFEEHPSMIESVITATEWVVDKLLLRSTPYSSMASKY